MATKIGQAIKNHTLFVYNLRWITGTKELKNYFSKFGPVNATVVFDRNTGLSKGFGFVTCEDDETLKSIFQTEHLLDGRKVEVRNRERRVQDIIDT